MKQSTFMTIQAVCFAFFAVALLFFPAQLWPMYGVAIPDTNAAFLSWHNTHFMFGLAFLCWASRKAELGSEAGRAILGAMLIVTVMGVLITGYSVVIGVFNTFGISDPVFYAVLAFGNAYFLKQKR